MAALEVRLPFKGFGVLLLATAPVYYRGKELIQRRMGMAKENTNVPWTSSSDWKFMDYA